MYGCMRLCSKTVTLIQRVNDVEALKLKKVYKTNFICLKIFIHSRKQFPVKTCILRHKKVQKSTSKEQICIPQLSCSSFFNAIFFSSQRTSMTSFSKSSQSQRSLYLAVKIMSNLIGSLMILKRIEIFISEN